MDTNSARGDALDQAVGNELRGLRAKRQMSREELSHRSGIGFKTIQRIEAGERSPSLRELDQLCGVLGVTPREFISGALADLERGGK
jgi:transcriptional regulator with XRE-family HTH domain